MTSWGRILAVVTTNPLASVIYAICGLSPFFGFWVDLMGERSASPKLTRGNEVIASGPFENPNYGEYTICC